MMMCIASVSHQLSHLPFREPIKIVDIIKLFSIQRHIVTKMMAMIFICCLLVTHSLGFTIPKSKTRSLTRLQVGAFIPQLSQHETEDEARFWISRAQQCAYGIGPFCSLEEAEQCLNEIVTLESGCVMGTMVDHDVCDMESQAMFPDIVARLQSKIHENDATVQTQERYVVEFLGELTRLTFLTLLVLGVPAWLFVLLVLHRTILAVGTLLLLSILWMLDMGGFMQNRSLSRQDFF